MHAVGEQHDLAPARARRRVAGQHVLAVPGGVVDFRRFRAAARGIAQAGSRRASRRGSSAQPRAQPPQQKARVSLSNASRTAASASTGSPQWKHATHAAAGPARERRRPSSLPGTAGRTNTACCPRSQRPSMRHAPSCGCRRTFQSWPRSIAPSACQPNTEGRNSRVRSFAASSGCASSSCRVAMWSKSPPVGNASMPRRHAHHWRRVRANARVRSGRGPRPAPPSAAHVVGNEVVVAGSTVGGDQQRHRREHRERGDRDQQPTHRLAPREDFASVARPSRRSEEAAFDGLARAAVGGADLEADRLAAVRRGIAGHRHRHRHHVAGGHDDPARVAGRRRPDPPAARRGSPARGRSCWRA